MSNHRLYQPKIADEHIRKLYRLAKMLNMPMTRLVNQLLSTWTEILVCCKHMFPALAESELYKNICPGT